MIKYLSQEMKKTGRMVLNTKAVICLIKKKT